ncbi:GTP pyrophosphokinase family protein [Pseudomonas fluorescens]|uniref:GTP pyrophosphokinase n=1 Tax=Pseudomonas fluorescens TaxID=294 RepID=UPI0006993D88|nr:hypothetical protein [Pseudomonas fluorescens]
MDNINLVNSYETKREVYETFAQTISNLISRLLGADGIAMHSVSYRCKTINSFKLKVEKKNGYEVLEQITDLAGVRLITHYEDDVDKVAKIIESEFLVDVGNTIDKRKALDPDRFGYLSLHYVVLLRPERTELKEYSSFAGLKAEVQVRSLLQHTWAEIEHDTGYKSTVEVPKHIRRRFSRLAGLLELADQEFIGIRDELENYSLAVEAKIANLPDKDGGALDVLVDKVSLQKFLEFDPLVSELDAEICQILNATCGADLKHALQDVSRLKVVGIETLAELKAALNDNRNLIIERARDVSKMKWGDPPIQREDLQLRYAICVLYLLQVLAGKSGDLNTINKNLQLMGLNSSDNLGVSVKTLIDRCSE